MQKSGAPFEEMKREARLLGEPMSEQDQPPQKLRPLMKREGLL